jgi:hypothetical protein
MMAYQAEHIKEIQISRHMYVYSYALFTKDLISRKSFVLTPVYFVK